MGNKITFEVLYKSTQSLLPKGKGYTKKCFIFFLLLHADVSIGNMEIPNNVTGIAFIDHLC